MLIGNLPRFCAAVIDGLVCVCLLPVVCLAFPADDEVEARITEHLAAGEFTVADRLAGQLDESRRDAALAQIARAQLGGGASRGAYRSAAAISGDNLRSETLSSLRQMSGHSGAAGGVTAADFNELMQLIQNVISPESWEEDGPSMRPYPAGVYVDAQGALQRTRRAGLANAAEFERRLGIDSGNRDFDRAADLRKVSLTRLERVLQRYAAEGRKPTDAMRHLAGLYRIEYVWFDSDSNEVLVAGPAGPMTISAEGQRVNRESGQPALLLDDWVQCLRNAWFEGGRMGCSIEPRVENLAAAQRFMATSRLNGTAYRTELQKALGWQDILIHGVDPNSHAAQVLVEADYLMKCVGLGVEPSVPEVPSYWDRIDLKNGPPPAFEVSRWWFTMNYDSILSNSAATLFQLQGQGVKVLSENELLAQNGERVHTGESQGPTKGFADDFTKHFMALCQKYPAFGQLRGVFDMALVAALVRNQVDAGHVRWAPEYFCGRPDTATLRYQTEPVRAAQTVMSVINHRMFESRDNGRRFRHMVVGVGGGVEFDANRILKSDRLKVAAASELERVAQPDAARPAAIEQWWWD